MPVEIRELIIRTSVEQDRRASAETTEPASTECGEENKTNQSSNQLAEMGKMIEEKNER
ncbi:MAG: DUF5908 family protein [Bacteroidota bacterium]